MSAKHSEVESATIIHARTVVDGRLDSATARIVWGIWAMMTIVALAFVWRFGSDVPFWDEWNMIDVATGAQRVSIEWLWAPHNGHRIPLPKLLLLGLYKLSGCDFRIGMYFNVAALAAVAAAMMWASQRIRQGEPSYFDAVFPLLLLHLGHCENLLWSWQATQIFPVMVVCGLLAVVAVYGFTPPPLAMTAAAIGVITLPLSGIPGLAYAPALVCWLAVTATSSYSRGQPRAAIALWGAAVTTVILIALYFHGYRSYTQQLSLLKAPRLELKTAVTFVIGGLGPLSSRLWRASGALTTLMMLGTVLALAWKARGGDQAATRAKALLLFFAGAACLVASFAFGRTGAGFLSRYFAMAAPVWCVTILALIVAFPPGISKLLQVSLMAALLLATPLNVSAGLRYAHEYNRRMEAFLAELLQGAPPEELVAHHVNSLCPCPWLGFAEAGVHQRGRQTWRSGFPLPDCVSFHEWITRCLRRLHDAKIGVYGRMNVQFPKIKEIMPSPETGLAITRAKSTPPHPDAADEAVLLTPEHPLYVAGVRVRRPSGSGYVPPEEVWHGDSKGRWVQVFWRLGGQADYMAPNRYVFLWDPGKDEQIVWIFGTVEQIALHFGDRPVQRSLRSEDLPISVLLPADR